MIKGLIAAVALFWTVAAAAPPPIVEEQVSPLPGTKQVYVVRHLHKAQGDDPPLSAEGAALANRLADMLQDKKVVAAFATPTRRAMETAAPLARRLAIPVTHYDPRNPRALAAAVAAATGPVLVVGHSNTVPDLVVAFGGSRPGALTEEDYGTVFVVESDGEVSELAIRPAR